jgi:hypothetical protein
MFNEDGLIIVPVIMAVSEMIKGLGFPTKFIPLINLALGLLAGFFAVPTESIVSSVVTGLVLGLSASGLYSGSKNVISGIKKK